MFGFAVGRADLVVDSVVGKFLPGPAVGIVIDGDMSAVVVERDRLESGCGIVAVIVFQGAVSGKLVHPFGVCSWLSL